MKRRESSPTIQNDRVGIRHWTPKDDITQRSWPKHIDPCSALWNIPRSLSIYSGLFSFGVASTYRLWAVERAGGELIGRISLREIDQSRKRARLGISLGAPYVGQGLGTDALRLFLDYFFENMGFGTMVLDVAAVNRRAVCCYERLGFRHIGHEWRKSSSSSCMRALDDPAYHSLLPYVRRERFGVWVQFFEMELQKQHWYERQLACPR